MRIDDNEYQIYKETDESIEEFLEGENTENLNITFSEYNKLETENIIRRRKLKTVMNNLSKELDKISKYPVISFDGNDDESGSYFITQIYFIILSLVYFFILFYYKTALVILLFPFGLYVGYKLGIIKDNN